jgi:hypothetical protein
MDHAKPRLTIVIAWIAAEAYQVFFGAFTSLQLGAPGIGNRASWAPNLLVAEAFTVLPIAFLLCLWGTQLGRTLATVGAAAMIVVALVAAAALGRWPSELVMFFALLLPAPLALAWSTRRMRNGSSVASTSVGQLNSEKS